MRWRSLLCIFFVWSATSAVSQPCSTVANPTTKALTSVYMLSATDGWAVGEGGTIIRWDGSSWSIVPSPTKGCLLSIYMLSPSDGWAVGIPYTHGWCCGEGVDSGTTIRWDGSSWSTVANPAECPLYSVYMLSATDGWAVGHGGIIMKWDGSSWSIVTDPDGGCLFSVYMLSPTDGWAVGQDGLICSIPPVVSDTSPVTNYPPVAENLKAEGQINPTHLTTLTPLLSWDYYDADNDAQKKFWVQVGISEDDNSLWDYISTEWKESDVVYYEPFDDLDNFDFDHPGAASVEIDPPGQLHYTDPGGGSWGHVHGWKVPNNFIFEIRTYFDKLGGFYYNLINSATLQFGVGFTKEGLLICQEHVEVPNFDYWNLILPRVVKYEKDAEWQIWRLVVIGDDWETASCDIYLADSTHTNQLMAKDVPCHVPALFAAGLPLSYETGGHEHTELHIDYAKVIELEMLELASNVTYGGSNLSWGGTYYWRVKCYDGYQWSRWTSGTFKMNSLPSLSSGDVSPSSGTLTTPFTYQITYKDRDGDPPSYVRVYVDGSAKSMSYVSGTYTEGAHYCYTTTLSFGPHTYYFEASDGFAIARFPEDSTQTMYGPIVVTVPVEEDKVDLSNKPRKYALQKNYPNPFNAETAIEYQLPQFSEVTIKIFNLQGQEVRILINGEKEAGYFKTIWDGKDNKSKRVAGGVYFYRIDAKSRSHRFVQTKKMILLR